MQLIKFLALGKVKLYSKLLLAQFKTKFKKPREYEIPWCGVSFTKMTKLAEEVKGIKVIKDQDTKSTTFKTSSKSPEVVFSFVSQMAELVVPNIDSPSKKDQKKLNELMPDVCVILAYLHSKKIIEKNIKYLKNGGNFLLIYPKPKLINFKNFRKYI